MPLGNKVFIFFVINSLVTAYAYQKELANMIIFCNILSFLLLGFQYIMSVKQISLLFLFVLLTIFLSEIFFNLKNYEKIIAYILALIYRSIFLLLMFKSSQKIDKKLLSVIITCFTIITTMVLSFVYNESVLFLMAVLNAIILILLSSILFINLLKTLSRGNVELFLGVFLIFIADATFVLPEFNWGYKIIFYSLIFQGAYYLLCRGMIKRQNGKLSNKSL